MSNGLKGSMRQRNTPSQMPRPSKLNTSLYVPKWKAIKTTIDIANRYIKGACSACTNALHGLIFPYRKQTNKQRSKQHEITNRIYRLHTSRYRISQPVLRLCYWLDMKTILGSALIAGLLFGPFILYFLGII